MKQLILGPMTSGKTTLLKNAGIDSRVLVDGDFPFQNPLFKPIWIAFLSLQGRFDLWEAVSIKLLHDIKVWGLVTHPFRAANPLAESLKYRLTYLLPFKTHKEMTERWWRDRRSWCERNDRWQEAAKDSFENTELAAFESKSTILRSYGEIDDFVEVIKAAAFADDPDPIPDGTLERLTDWLMKSAKDQIDNHA